MAQGSRTLHHGKMEQVKLIRMCFSMQYNVRKKANDVKSKTICFLENPTWSFLPLQGSRPVGIKFLTSSLFKLQLIILIPQRLNAIVLYDFFNVDNNLTIFHRKQ